MEERIVEYEMDICVHGYHAYKEIGKAVVGERLISEREPENERHMLWQLKTMGKF